MLGICTTCGHAHDIEDHHVAGQHNYPTFTVPVCVDCHRILTAWQRAHGVQLDEDSPREDVDRVRALATGVFDLIRLLGQRHPDQVLLSHALRHLNGRAMSRLLDQFAPPDRPGRWLPDPTQPPVDVRPVAFLEETELDLVVLFAQMTLQFLDLFDTDETQAAPRCLLQAVANHPAAVRDAWEELTADQARSRSLLDDLQAQLRRAMHAVRWMLTAGPDSAPDPELLEEIRLWFATGRRLLDQLLDMLELPAVATQ